MGGSFQPPAKMILLTAQTPRPRLSSAMTPLPRRFRAILSRPLAKIQSYGYYRNVKSIDAIDAFSALAQPTRLAVIKLLVRAGPEGMASGEIARVVEAPASTMSTHLAVLARSGLVSSRRDSRLIYYAADMTGLSDLLGYLIEDCCEGHPDICMPLAKVMERAGCCAPANAAASSIQKKRRKA